MSNSGEPSLFRDVVPVSKRLPIGMIASALVLVLLLILGLAYFSRVPYGSEIEASRDLETAINDHFIKDESRSLKQMTVYNCSGFFDSLIGGEHIYAATVELGVWRPNSNVNEATKMIGSITRNVWIVSARKDEKSAWEIASLRIPGGDYAAAVKPKDSSTHPCTIKPRFSKK